MGSQGGRLTAPQAFGQAINRTGGFNSHKSQHFFFALGQQIGSFGQLTENGTFGANFDVNYTPVSANYPLSAPSEVVVQQGDTLRIIAARVFGDATLWYLLAEENGLTDPDARLEPGTVIRVPNEVIAPSNTGSSFKPFNAQEAIGDTSPTQPVPPAPRKRRGCGVLGQILVIVVAIVVTIYTAGAFASAAGATTQAGAAAAAQATAAGATNAAVAAAAAGATSPFGLGVAAIGGKLVTLAGAPLLGTSIAAAAVGGAVGSIASQGVAIAAGLQDRFSWRGIATSAISGGVAAGLGSVGILSKFAEGGGASTRCVCRWRAVGGDQWLNAGSFCCAGTSVEV
jgi:nucleoid-associated protein YgaU